MIRNWKIGRDSGISTSYASGGVLKIKASAR